MMKELIKACNKEEVEKVFDACKDIIDAHYDILKASAKVEILGEKPSDIDLTKAKNAITVLNKMCANKKIKPVFTGSLQKVEDIARFAAKVVESDLLPV